MKLIAQVKLIVTPEQADVLKRTLRLTNTACDYIVNSLLRFPSKFKFLVTLNLIAVSTQYLIPFSATLKNMFVVSLADTKRTTFLPSAAIDVINL